MYFSDMPLFPSGGGSNYRIPSVAADRHGTFYAFCNDRRGTLSDAAGEVYLCFARKKAGMEWEEPRPLIAVEGWATSMGSAVYDPVTDTVMCCGEKIPVQRREFGHYSAEQLAAYEAEAERKARELGILRGRFVLFSGDGGETWGERPHEIEKRAFTHTDGREILLGGSCHGSAHGICLRHGPHAGRLICPSRTQAGQYANWDELRLNVYNNALWSDDHGLIWHASAPVQLGTGEGTLIEQADGSLTYNSRAYFRDGLRYLATSTDGGETWVDFRADAYLREETFCGCNASFLRLERDELADPSLLPPDADGITLFANPRAEKRVNMAVCWSFDGGRTWAGSKTVFAGPSSYSSLDYARAADRFVLLYERGEEDPCDGGIAAAEFDLAWLFS
ncbi:MAG: exo-alpha-sialidase [Clostridia bacterium]|nr:exo-alpha-sialidase [Clostridia bacterium]